MVPACSVSAEVPVIDDIMEEVCGRGRNHTVRQEVRENWDRSAITPILKRISQSTYSLLKPGPQRPNQLPRGPTS